jgi:glycosyltransferase involved in cell wall biosynthesis
MSGKTARPTLALLIPAYNAEAHLPRLFESVRAQTVPFDEVWLYDDASQDSTSEVAERHGAHIVRGLENRGCTHGKNALATATSCDWVHFHDSDDLLLPDFVERARQWMRDTDADVVVFGCEERWEDSRELIAASIPDDGELSRDAIRYTIERKINAISSIYRRERFVRAGGFDDDPRVLYNEDQAGHSLLARGGLKFRGDPAICVVNLRRRGSMWTSNAARCFAARLEVLLKSAQHPASRIHSDAIAAQLWLVAAAAASYLDWTTADRAVSSANGLSPRAHGGRLFRVLCRISPRFALRVREISIRAFRPRLRAEYPRLLGRNKA